MAQSLSTVTRAFIALILLVRRDQDQPMPRDPRPRQPQGPSLSPEQARIQLERSIEVGSKILQEQPLTEQRYEVWQTNAFEKLKAAFGKDSGHVYNFVGQGRFYPSGTPESYLEGERRKRLGEQVEFLRAVIEEFPPAATQAVNSGSDFFDDLDADIRRVSEQLFKDGHYADSISAAFRELNHHVKLEYKRRKNVELDGAELMHTAFSPTNPVFVLADQSSRSGKDIQQGFMELFAGSMIGIRNPHAHENLSLDSDSAKHFLYLASLLMKKFKTVR
jgi:uncharacterized protein (TIGR02391 family)